MNEPSHIFVYGTLRSESDHPMARRLSSQARLVGKGSAPGRLYDCGWYPAAMFDDAEKRLIVGDVFALKPGGRLLAELDAYEAGDPNYVRVPLEVKLADGGTVTAWGYSVSTAPQARLIHSGDFIAHKRAKTRRPIRP
ncbi:MAG TPA: gamma-glutamylcyclotransferase family protein [Methyloceanibacter sp.]|nr:gamma-glutamylcyclotransferase family protein [Methyloceanibacter sp.]